MKKKSRIAKVETKTPIYKLVIYFNGNVCNAEGDELLPLLQSFKLPFIKTETNVLVIKDKKTVQRDLKVVEANRLWGNKVKLELFANNLTRQLN